MKTESIHRLLRCSITACVLVAACVVPTFQPVVRAESDNAEPLTAAVPLAVVTVAGVDRLLGDIGFVFDAADRPEMKDNIDQILERLGNLKGLARDRPFGAMIFLRNAFPPQPEAVFYVPVDNIDDLLKTIELGPVVTNAVDGSPDRYEIIGPARTLQVRIQGQFAFIGRDPDLLDREFPDPDRYARTLINRYDVSLGIDVANIPEGLRATFLQFLKVSTATELQQKDDEPDAQYQIRKANGESVLEFIEQVLTQGDRLTLGINASEEERFAAIELLVEARPDSRFAAYLDDIGSRPTQFKRLLQEDLPLTLSVSWKMDKREKTSALKSLDGFELAALRALNGEDGELVTEPLPDTGPVARIFRTLRATVEAGHFDGFMQFVGLPPEKLVLVGGAKLIDGHQLSAGLVDILEQLRDNPALEDLSLNADNHQGIAFHRIEGKNARQQDEVVYGSRPALFIGVGDQVLWFAVGGDDAMDRLKQTMDLHADQTIEADDNDLGVPFRAVVNVARWFGLEDSEDDLNRGQKLAREAFEPGNDQVQIDFRPTDSGARLRIDMDEGFIRMLGMQAARGIEQQQRARERRRQGSGRDQNRNE